MSSGADR